jgi:predicted dehydrogenase
MAGRPVVRLASIGLGWWGNVLAEAAASSGEAEIVSCFARDPDARGRFADKHGCAAVDSLDSIWSDPDVDGVLLATPHSTHATLIQEIAAAGKHAFVEKPLALTLDETRRSVDAARSAGVVLQVGYNKRRQVGNRLLHDKLTGGELGQLQSLETNLSAPLAFKPDLPQWRQTPVECPAGGMTTLGVHMIDLILHLAGPVREVFCRSRRVTKRLGLDDVTMVMMEVEAGGLAYLGTMVAVPATATAAVYGTDATGWSEADGGRFFLQRRGEPYREELPVDPIDTVHDEMVEFARCIRNGTEPETGGRESVAVAEVFDAIIRSVETGRPAVVRE